MLFIIVFLLSFFSGVISGTSGGMFAGILVGIFVGIILQICWSDAKYKSNDSNKIKELKQNIKNQDKYDNDWGIIDYEDK